MMAGLGFVILWFGLVMGVVGRQDWRSSGGFVWISYIIENAISQGQIGLFFKSIPAKYPHFQYPSRGDQNLVTHHISLAYSIRVTIFPN
jgi:hypothetical protein